MTWCNIETFEQRRHKRKWAGGETMPCVFLGVSWQQPENAGECGLALGLRPLGALRSCLVPHHSFPAMRGPEEFAARRHSRPSAVKRRCSGESNLNGELQRR